MGCQHKGRLRRHSRAGGLKRCTQERDVLLAVLHWHAAICWRTSCNDRGTNMYKWPQTDHIIRHPGLSSKLSVLQNFLWVKGSFVNMTNVSWNCLYSRMLTIKHVWSRQGSIIIPLSAWLLASLLLPSISHHRRPEKFPWDWLTWERSCEKRRRYEGGRW